MSLISRYKINRTPLTQEDVDRFKGAVAEQAERFKQTHAQTAAAHRQASEQLEERKTASAAAVAALRPRPRGGKKEGGGKAGPRGNKKPLLRFELRTALRPAPWEEKRKRIPSHY